VPHVPIRDEDLIVQAGKIKPSELPKISKKDPVVQWFGFPSGTILKICDPAFTSFRVVDEL
jgi:DNA-directed RNA polymerase subunit H (RpoH/RPB5)